MLENSNTELKKQGLLIPYSFICGGHLNASHTCSQYECTRWFKYDRDKL
jgi:hypothetical protein